MNTQEEGKLMTNPTFIKVAKNIYVTEDLHVGDKVKYYVHGDNTYTVDTVVRLEADRAHLKSGDWVSTEGQMKFPAQKVRYYMGKYTQEDQLNNKLKTFQKMLVQDADDLKHKNSDSDIREPKDNPKVYINSLRDMRNRINKALEWAQELEKLQNRG